MQTKTQNPDFKNTKKYLEEREAVKKAMEKMKQELKDPEIRAVFQRLKNK